LGYDPMELRNNLPHSLTSFVGRKREVRQVRALVADARLVTLTGAGGAGKTRLALEAARGMIDHFADGVWLVELAPLSEARLIQPTLAQALQIHEQPGRPLAATLSDHLRTKQILLLFDNCEHLAADVASMVEAFLHVAPGLHVLVTSRVQLGIDGERTWRVPQLVEAEATALFAERAGHAHDAFVLTSQNSERITEICRRLDGVPLAIELAAARLRTISVDEIAARLTDRFALLTGGSRTALPRHQTLEATMDWSHELLPPAAQCLWRRLAVFAGGFGLDAAEAVCSDDVLDQTNVVDLLALLVDSSLVQVEETAGARRYQLLETIREYGLRKLDEAGETEAFRRRHLEWFRALAQRAEPEWRGANQGPWLDRLEADLDNVRAALDYSRTRADRVDDGLALASALWLLWHSRDHIGESRQWLRSLLDQAGPGRARAYGLNVAGFMAYVQGDTAAAVPLLEESLRLNESLGDRTGANFSLLRLGIGLYYNNELERAVGVLDQALARYRESGDRIGIYISAYELAEALTMRGDYLRATTLHEESLALKQQQGDAWHIGLSYFGLGLLAWRQGDHRQAVARLRESIVLRQELEEWWGLTRAIEALGWVEASRDNLRRATHLMGAAKAMLERSSTALSPNYLVHHERSLQVVSAGLLDREFEAAWAAGHRLSAPQAVDYALKGGTLPTGETRRPGEVSPREAMIARLVASGMTNRQIASKLSLAERTVDSHVEHIMNKLGYRSRAQIAAWIATRPHPALPSERGREP
ncbi:MAG TPA: LuxR C-terminal-related transcriptional regulator, partial [Candidatus Dormibacteraeota bacterium]